MQTVESVTRWLNLWREGDPEAMDRVTALVYQDLRRLAAWHLKSESGARNLEATALVHEVYLRMPSLQSVEWTGRPHFISVVTKMMRQILVDNARARNAAKRNAPASAGMPVAEEPSVLQIRQLDALAVDQTLVRMSRRYPRCAQVVEFRFFGDLDFEEIADVMNLSLATVERDWRFARAWLRKNMAGPL